jgi:hypothetical protein
MHQCTQNMFDSLSIMIIVFVCVCIEHVIREYQFDHQTTMKFEKSNMNDE